MVTKIISGSQVGADISGLRAARALGFETGGYVTKGNKTLAGNRPDLISKYNLTELPTDNYATRTEANVQAADGTIRVAWDFDSPGERCTLKAILRRRKPYLDIPMGMIDSPITDLEFKEWIRVNKIKVLNVAGNANPSIEQPIISFLVRNLTK